MRGFRHTYRKQENAVELSLFSPESLVNIWLSLPKSEVELERKEVFKILEGEEQISLKADEILGKAEKELSVFISEYDITNFYHSGFWINWKKHLKRAYASSF